MVETKTDPLEILAAARAAMEIVGKRFETSEYFIPSVPIEIPSLIVIVPKTCGIAPLSLNAEIARSASGWIPALQGVIVL